jgi:hypothetical protein
MSTLPRRTARAARWASVLVVLSLASHASYAVAQPKSECVAAHADAQLLRKKEQLSEAREKLSLCAHKTCPALVQKDCTQWLAEVDAEQPTIVVVAKDENGNDTLDVRVSLDGRLVSESLVAGAVAVDPGEHTLVFEHGSAKPIEVKLVLRAGEKGRRVDADFSANVVKPPIDDTGESTLRIPTASWILWGVGGAAMISWAYFGISGRARESDLSSSCAPHCSQDDVDGLKRKYLIADVSLGVGVVAIAIGTVLMLSTASDPKNDPKNEAGSSTAVSFDVRALPGGGAFAVGGSF